MVEKVCKRCDVSKPLSGFYDDKDYADDKSPWCRECVRQYGKDYRAAQKAKKRPQQSFSEISTSTDLSCSACLKQIGCYEKCLASSGGLYYHVGCKPKDNPEARGSTGPSVTSGGTGDDGEE